MKSIGRGILLFVLQMSAAAQLPPPPPAPVNGSLQVVGLYNGTAASFSMDYAIVALDGTVTSGAEVSHTFSNLMPGVYILYRLSGGMSGNFHFDPDQTVIVKPGETATVTAAFETAPSLTVRATMDGQNYSGSVNYAVVPQNILETDVAFGGSLVPQLFPNLELGTYSVMRFSGGPNNSTYSGLVPNSAELLPGGSGELVMNFASLPAGPTVTSAVPVPSTPDSYTNFDLLITGGGFVSGQTQVWVFGDTSCQTGCQHPAVGVINVTPTSLTAHNVQLAMGNYYVKLRNTDNGVWSNQSSLFIVGSASPASVSSVFFSAIALDGTFNFTGGSVDLNPYQPIIAAPAGTALDSATFRFYVADTIRNARLNKTLRVAVMPNNWQTYWSDPITYSNLPIAMSEVTFHFSGSNRIPLDTLRIAAVWLYDEDYSNTPPLTIQKVLDDTVATNKAYLVLRSSIVPSLYASCLATPAAILPGQTAIFAGTYGGGTTPVITSWGGVVSGSDLNTSFTTTTLTLPAGYAATFTVTDSGPVPQTVNVSCAVQVIPITSDVFFSATTFDGTVNITGGSEALDPVQPIVAAAIGVTLDTVTLRFYVQDTVRNANLTKTVQLGVDSNDWQRGTFWSDPIPYSDLPTTMSDVTFHFSGSNRLPLDTLKVYDWYFNDQVSGGNTPPFTFQKVSDNSVIYNKLYVVLRSSKISSLHTTCLASPNVILPGQSATFTGNYGGGMLPVTGGWGGIVTGDGNSVVFTTSPATLPGIYTATYTVTDSSSIPQSVTTSCSVQVIQPAPGVFFSATILNGTTGINPSGGSVDISPFQPQIAAPVGVTLDTVVLRFYVSDTIRNANLTKILRVGVMANNWQNYWSDPIAYRDLPISMADVSFHFSETNRVPLDTLKITALFFDDQVSGNNMPPLTFQKVSDTTVNFNPIYMVMKSSLSPSLYAECSGSPNTILPGQTVTFTGSYGGGTGIIAMNWTGAVTGSGSSVTYSTSTATSPGIYTAIYTVTDSSLTPQTASASCIVQVMPNTSDVFFSATTLDGTTGMNPSGGTIDINPYQPQAAAPIGVTLDTIAMRLYVNDTTRNANLTKTLKLGVMANNWQYYWSDPIVYGDLPISMADVVFHFSGSNRVPLDTLKITAAFFDDQVSGNNMPPLTFQRVSDNTVGLNKFYMVMRSSLTSSLYATCSANPRTILPGQTATFTGGYGGGTGMVATSWGGIVSGSDVTAIYITTEATSPGIYTATLSITDNGLTPQTAVVSCPVQVMASISTVFFSATTLDGTVGWNGGSVWFDPTPPLVAGPIGVKFDAITLRFYVDEATRNANLTKTLRIGVMANNWQYYWSDPIAYSDLPTSMSDVSFRFTGANRFPMDTLKVVGWYFDDQVSGNNTPPLTFQKVSDGTVGGNPIYLVMSYSLATN